MNSTTSDTKQQISQMIVSFGGLWNTIQDNTEKAVLYALIGGFVGLFGVLLVINILLCKKLSRIERKRKNSKHRNGKESAGRKNQTDKHPSPERLQIMERAPSGGWTFHEGCSKNSQTPQSFASSPLLPAWDVFVHVDSPHESPALVSVSNRNVEGETCVQLSVAPNDPQEGEGSSDRHEFVPTLLQPHLPAVDRREPLLDLVAVSNNNNNEEEEEDENSIWIRRSHLKLELDQPSYLPLCHKSHRPPLTEV